MAEHWTEPDVPAQPGRTAVVTGANSGLGWEVARVLAARGATVVLACRDTGRGLEAADRIRARVPDARLAVTELDLASLASVRAAAARLREQLGGRLDLLVNNAGVMMPPRGRTADGFELQFGVNHLGHVALTGLLLDLMLDRPGARVVAVSSTLHWLGRINLDDLQSQRHYHRTLAYAQSKLANLMFARELAARLAQAGAAATATAAHPGVSRTGLTRHLPGLMRATFSLGPVPGSAHGAVPLLRAATDPAARGGDYFGPAGLGEMSGPAGRAAASPRSRDAGTSARLWAESLRLTGVSYPL